MSKINILGISAIFLLALNILSIIYLQTEMSNITKQNNPTALATGITSLCINNPPSNITEGTCNFTMPWGYPIDCYLNATDPENNSIIYQFNFPSGTTIFNVTNSGHINVTLPQTTIGNHILRITANDLSGCGNNVLIKDFNISVIDSNHAPYLIQIIPNQTINRDTVYSFFLNNYFADIDGDILSYLSSQNNNLTSISIDNMTSLVNIRGLDCGESEFFFIATDPDGLTATSNTIVYSVQNCPQEEDEETSGGGGGGGGGSGSFFDCTSDWRCSRWSACASNGTRTLRCIDYQGCNPDDYIRFFSENCTYVPEEYICEEKWECSEWSQCLNDTHTRKCIDKNSCGTKNTKPPEQEACIPIASCFNGIRDGDETGIDCGGQCGSCSNVEQPAVIESGFNQKLLIALGITIAAIGLIIFALRKQIKQWISSIFENKRQKMPVYISEVQKQKLLNMVYKTQEYFENKEYANFDHSIAIFLEAYFSELLHQYEISSQSENKSLQQRLSKLNNKQVESIIYDMQKNLLKQKNQQNSYQIQQIIDKLFSMIYLISSFEEKDALVQPKERSIDAKEDIDRFYQELSNLHIALEFREIVEAKSLYTNILNEYNKFNQKQKKELYDEMMIAYNIILYIERFY
ncbi:MAG: hypothetical protein ACP5NV_00140 [Candidatus Woesearchaeota archaeon]